MHDLGGSEAQELGYAMAVGAAHLRLLTAPHGAGLDVASAASLLEGVRTSRLILFVLITSGVVVGLAGVLLTSQLSTGESTVGPGYPLPVIAAVFLGSTQFRAGWFNIGGPWSPPMSSPSVSRVCSWPGCDLDS